MKEGGDLMRKLSNLSENKEKDVTEDTIKKGAIKLERIQRKFLKNWCWDRS